MRLPTISPGGQERQLLQAAGRMAEDAFKKVWNHSEDDAVDQLYSRG